jgi:PhoPQ-activated pathogenicity-related protein
MLHSNVCKPKGDTMRRFLAAWMMLALLALAALLPASLAQEAQPQEQPEKPQPAKEDKSELHKYVEKKDKAYKWEKVSEKELVKGTKLYELKLTSQVWHEITWTHSIQLIVPEKISKKPTHVLLLIVGSGKARDELIVASAIVNQIGAPMAILYDIPNQPLFDRLREDDLIAHTFMKFMETKDPTWPLLLPMTKAAVKAMDALEEFLKKELVYETAGFVVTGASKRGWTTWLTAAVDKRVKAIAPMVYDNLDLVAQMKHQKETWGEFSRMIRPYTKRDIPQILLSGDKDAKKLSDLVDPFTYLDRITVPKLIIIGTNDEYWPLDAANLYWDKLKGEKYLLYVPNEGHGLGKGMMTAVQSIAAFFLKTQGDLKFPDAWWSYQTHENSVSIRYVTDTDRKSAKIWIAKSTNLDFRKATWDSVPLFKGKSLNWHIPIEKEKHLALFVEATYEKDGIQYSLCTNVKIFPPLKEEKGEEGEKEQQPEEKQKEGK